MKLLKWSFKKKHKITIENPITVEPYQYRRVNFLDGFRKMNFEFLEEEPDLLVEKILSVDPDWIGNADYQSFGRASHVEDRIYQSNSTKVPCLEGEWIVVCYSKETRIIKDNEVWSGSDWHKYYLCQIDFSHEYQFRVVKDFEHIYEAFKYLYDNRLVSIIRTDQRFQKQINVYNANIMLSVLKDFEKEEEEFTYEELARFFKKHSNKNEEIRAYLLELEQRARPMTPNDDDFICRVLSGRFLSTKPYGEFVLETNNKLTIHQYLNLVREYKENYVWNL